MFCATMKALLQIAAHLIVAVLLAAPLAAQRWSGRLRRARKSRIGCGERPTP